MGTRSTVISSTGGVAITMPAIMMGIAKLIARISGVGMNGTAVRHGTSGHPPTATCTTATDALNR